MGIETIGDLLEHYPRDYKDRSRLTKIADLSETDENTFLARVKGEGQTGRRGRLTFTRLQVFDDTDEITLLWYNQPYMKTALKSGEVYLFTGRMQKNITAGKSCRRNMNPLKTILPADVLCLFILR